MEKRDITRRSTISETSGQGASEVDDRDLERTIKNVNKAQKTDGQSGDKNINQIKNQRTNKRTV